MSEVLKVQHPSGVVVNIEGYTHRHFYALPVASQHDLIEYAYKTGDIVSADAKRAEVEKASTFTRLEKGLRSYCEKEGIPVAQMWTRGLDVFKRTDEGAALKAQYDENPESSYDSVQAKPAPMTKRAPALEELTEKLTKFCAAEKIEKLWTEGLERWKSISDENRELAIRANEGE